MLNMAGLWLEGGEKKIGDRRGRLVQCKDGKPVKRICDFNGG